MVWHGSPVRFSARTVADAVGGQLVGPDVEFDGASIDSRQLVVGQMFVALVASRDGHEFVADAIVRGAGVALVHESAMGVTSVVVDDTAVALRALGATARRRLSRPVVAITGSVGKTSVKELTAAALGPAYRVAASLGSHNNELGVPLTLINAPDDLDVLIVEMGARAVGDIRSLVEVAMPTIGVVTAVGAAHLETFGTIDDVAAAKGEMVEGLDSHGVAVLNADDPRVLAMSSRTTARVLTYGSVAGDVRVMGLRLDEVLRPSFRLATPWGAADVHLSVRGAHMAENAAAAAAAALAAGASLESIVAGLAGAEPLEGRMRVLHPSSGAAVIDDSYNANPTSMVAALRALAGMPATRRVAVLGSMAELGTTHDEGHRAVITEARGLGIELVVVGEPAYGVGEVATVESAVEMLGDVGPGDVILVKASRVAGLERVVDRLMLQRRPDR